MRQMLLCNGNFRSIFNQFVTDAHHKDIMIVCRDGSLLAHRVILAAAAPFIKGLLQEPTADTIMLPDFDKSTLSDWLHLVYSGELIIEENNMHNFGQLVTTLNFNLQLPVGSGETGTWTSNTFEEEEQVEEAALRITNVEHVMVMEQQYDLNEEEENHNVVNVEGAEEDGKEEEDKSYYKRQDKTNTADCETEDVDEATWQPYMESSAKQKVKRTFRCYVCFDTFQASYLVTAHMKRKHPGKNTFRCDLCLREFNSLRKMHKHRRNICKKSSNRRAVHTCTHCGKVFGFEHELQAHSKCCSTQFADQKLLQINCQKCERSFVSSQALALHMSEAHRGGGAKPPPASSSLGNLGIQFTCLFCQEMFESEKLLVKHRKMHGSRPNYPCMHCRSSFYSEFEFHKHVTQHKTYKPNTCLVCGRVCVRRQSFLSHLRSHYLEHKPPVPTPKLSSPALPVPPQEFQCSICADSFQCSSDLESHQTSHPINFPFQCNICKKSYDSAKTLMTHSCSKGGGGPSSSLPKTPLPTDSLEKSRVVVPRNRHLQTFCYICHNNFVTYGEYLQHIKTHPPGSRYRCDVCFRSYKSMFDCREHRMIHFGKKNFKCSVCSRSYYTRGLLRAHLRKSHGIFQTPSKNFQ